MSQAQGEQYYLCDEARRPQYVNNAGIVDTVADGTTIRPDNGLPAHLQKAPDGWLSVLIKYTRNLKYLGLNRDFTVPMRFVKDGAKIVRNALWRFGQDTILYLVIMKLNRFTFPPLYEPYYNGEVDLSKNRDGEFSITAQVLEGGLAKMLKAYENTQYTIPISTDGDKRVAYFDGLPFTNNVGFTLYENQVILNEYFIGMGVISQEGTTQGIITQDQQYLTTFDNPFDATHYNNNWHGSSATKEVLFQYRGTVTVLQGGSGNVELKIRRYDQVSDTITDFTIHNGVLAAGPHVLDVTLDIPVTPNQFLYLVGKGTLIGQTRISAGAIGLIYEVSFTPSLAECLTPLRLAEALVDKMTNGRGTVRSTFLQALSMELLITSGPALRRYQAESAIKTSYTDFFKSLLRYGVGTSIEGDVLVIEKHAYFFRDDIVAELGQVDKCEFAVAEDMTFNTIKAGYPNVAVDTLNGRDEVNVQVNYATPHTRIVRELDLVSEYHAGMYEIEQARIALYQQDTTSSSVDNTNYMISVAPGATYQYYKGAFEAAINTGNPYFLIPGQLGVITPGKQFTISGAAANNGTYTVVNTTYLIVGFTFIQVLEAVTPAQMNGTITATDADFFKLNRPAYTAVSGILHPAEAFNLPLRPSDAIRNNGSYIRSFHDKLDGSKITFTKGDRNSDLSTTIGGVTTTEGTDILIGGLAAPFACGYYAFFTASLQENFYYTLKNNPYGRYGFIYRGDQYYGYIWDAGFAPATLEKQKFQLLLVGGTDTTKLIH